MTIVSIHFTSSKPRKIPREGDRKTVRGMTYERVWARVSSGPDRGCLIVSRGKPVWDWVRVSE